MSWFPDFAFRVTHLVRGGEADALAVGFRCRSSSTLYNQWLSMLLLDGLRRQVQRGTIWSRQHAPSDGACRIVSETWAREMKGSVMQ